MSNNNIILVTQNSPPVQFFAVGEPPYTKPNIAHPSLSARINKATNHSLSVILDSTQDTTGNILDLIVNYKLYLDSSNSNPNPITVGSIDLLKGEREISFSNLVEGKNYSLETEYYMPYWKDISSKKTFAFKTTNTNDVDLTDFGEQNQDRDNSLTVTMELDDHPEDITIELEDVQETDTKKEPLLRINLSEKPKNSELKLLIRQIPYGLYNLNILDRVGDGLPKPFTISKYDNGQTTSSDFKEDFGFKKTILMTFGKLKLKSAFSGSVANISDLNEVKERRARRGGAFLSTTGSFTLSSGSNTAGND